MVLHFVAHLSFYLAVGQRDIWYSQRVDDRQSGSDSSYHKLVVSGVIEGLLDS